MCSVIVLVLLDGSSGRICALNMIVWIMKVTTFSRISLYLIDIVGCCLQVFIISCLC